MGPAADQVAAHDQAADRHLADLAAGQAAGRNVGLGLRGGGRLSGPFPQGRPQGRLFDAAADRANPRRSYDPLARNTDDPFFLP